MHWWNDGWHMGWMVLGWILGLLFLAALVWVLVRATQRPGDSPEEILKRRYARGEISREEYERRLSDLRR
ncbi:MAG TPA: SHOCT domain-containing protein [Myxococcaceae bacterium]|nr:SHOCT domain-containing protein [Myxococcaceae bacterium]